MSFVSLTECLAESLVLPALRARTKEAVLREMVESLAREQPDLDADQLFGELCARERLGSTAISEGVAIPHGKLPGLSRLWLVVGRQPEGVDFASLDGSPTRLFFLLVAPQDSPGQHLKALAHVSRMLKGIDFRESLMSAPDRAELYRRIVARDGQ
jgi:nitrogen PTS system EIIA component